jgi:hypothetical protein
MFKLRFWQRNSSTIQPKKGSIKAELVETEEEKLHDCGHRNRSFSTYREGDVRKTKCRECRQEELKNA